ncbi:hypothetical protein FH972_024679 [Carpinus fangiana]|uniref:GH64 domain-containing protein n=1 Tax=Carpinus fangiana TaxID=176857 RepID=A0A5N6KZL0_9ROSI|nr:hypothetical protein FH972_024679 [Carpinus fangiana]
MVKYSTLAAASLLGTAQAMALPKSMSLAVRGAYGNNTIVHPTPANEVTDKTLILTPETTLNSTSGSSIKDAPGAPLSLSFVNNFAGGSTVNAYLVGTDPNGQVVFLKPDGTYYNPPNPDAGASGPTQVDAASIAIPLGAVGSTTTVSLGEYISSGRIYFSAGDLYFAVNHGDAGPNLVQPNPGNTQDPSAGLNWGFAEFTWNAQQLFANISYVDFVGLVIGMMLTETSGATQQAQGLPAEAVTTICQALQQQAAADGQPWDQLCVTDTSGNPLRILSPNQLVALGVGGPFQDYWTDYVNQVYDSFASTPLTINTQGDAGDVQGTYNAGTGNIEFANGGSFSKPGALDIFGCNSGPFANSGDAAHLAIVARLCAAFNRSTLLLSGGSTQPNGVTDTTQYYSTAPTNYYSKFVHSTEIDGRGYAFAYDDVHGDSGADLAGTVNAGDPQSLTVVVGGPSA